MPVLALLQQVAGQDLTSTLLAHAPRWKEYHGGGFKNQTLLGKHTWKIDLGFDLLGY